VLRELRAWPTVLLVAFCLLIGVPVTVALTPEQDVVALGQHLSVGARTPTLSLSGPAQLVQIGNTELDMPRLRIHGPLRPRLTMGPVQRNAAAAQVFDPLTSAQAQAQAIDNVTRGFLRWYLWGGLGLLLFALAAAAGAGCLRMLAVLRARSRAGEDAGPHVAAEIWHHLSGAIARMTAIAVAASALAWVAAGGLAYTGTVHGLQQVGSLTDLVGSSSLSPEPAGPAVTGFTGAVIGDSRAVRVGGPPVPDPSPADAACGRSTDSLAAELGNLLAVPVLSLACPSATTSAGLLGPAGAGRAAAAPAGRRAQAGAGAAVRRGRDRAERPGLVRPRHLLLRRSRTAPTTSARASSTIASPRSTATTAPCSPSWPHCPGSRRWSS
jgi:hypothetical protein